MPPPFAMGVKADNQRVWKAGGKTLEFQRPLVMGILNITPDSFYDGGRFYTDGGLAAKHGVEMLDAGADILDIGGESSRPGSGRVPVSEELSRILPALRSVLRQRPEAVISVDTWKAEVAQAALSEGALVVNDISAGAMDKSLLPLIAAGDCGYVLMHMQGTPEDMQKRPQYADVVGDVRQFFIDKLERLDAAGIARDRIVLDPGIGFGKKSIDNLALIVHLEKLRVGGRPLLYGISRKSFIGTMLDRPPEDRLDGTTALHMALLSRGADILRAHDVPAAVDAVKTFLALKELEHGV
jgi:dihydropteroate synthase